MSVKVSVLLPVHNGEVFLAQAVESILAQTMVDWELIVIDDGSTDGSASIAAAYADSRIRCIHRPKEGLPNALNAGLAVARGEYVARQDADDFSSPDRLRVQSEFLDAHPAVCLVGCGFHTITPDERRIETYRGPILHDELADQLGRLVNPFPHTGIMFRAAAVNALGGYRQEFRKAQDYDLYLRLMEHHALATVPNALCSVRVRTSSATSDDAGGDQLRFGVLALASSLARRRQGSDPLESPARGNFIAAFDEWYSASRYPEIFRSKQARKHARMAWSQGGVGRAAALVARSLVNDALWPLEYFAPNMRSIASAVERWVIEMQGGAR